MGSLKDKRAVNIDCIDFIGQNWPSFLTIIIVDAHKFMCLNYA